MRDEREIRLLRFAELIQRLEQALPEEKLQESDVRTAVKLFANHGLARPLKFGDLVLLATGTLERLRAARSFAPPVQTRTRSVRFSKPTFSILISTFTGVDRLKHRADEELLLHALVQTFLDHSLCIAEDTPQWSATRFSFTVSSREGHCRAIRISSFRTRSAASGNLCGLLLVVRLWYSQEFKHKELWRNAAEFVVT